MEGIEYFGGPLDGSFFTEGTMKKPNKVWVDPETNIRHYYVAMVYMVPAAGKAFGCSGEANCVLIYVGTRKPKSLEKALESSYRKYVRHLIE